MTSGGRGTKAGNSCIRLLFSYDTVPAGAGQGDEEEEEEEEEEDDEDDGLRP